MSLILIGDMNAPGVIVVGTEAHMNGLFAEGCYPYQIPWDSKRIQPDGSIDCGEEVGCYFPELAPDHLADPAN